MKKLLRFLAVAYIAYGVVTLGFVGQLAWRVWRDWLEWDAGASPIQWVPLASFLVIGVAIVGTFIWLGFLLFQRRRWRMALILAGISCLGIPVGTVLGALTIYALTRPEIRSEFAPAVDP